MDGLFDRSRGAAVTVTPDVARPRQTVTATVTTHRPIHDVATATLEWGYDNFYRQVAGSGDERDADAWVCVTRAELPVTASEFTGASVTFKVPSWAPGSSPEIARWSCRLRIQRGDSDVDEHGEFTVVIGAADVDAVEEPLERLSGAGTTEIDIALGSPLYLAGETVAGRLVLRPTGDLTAGEVAVHWQCEREFHPLDGHPADGGPVDGPIVALGTEIVLGDGVAVTLPFALPLPADAAPTASAVHSSLSWYVAAHVRYAGDGHRVERVRRPITVVNAP